MSHDDGMLPSAREILRAMSIPPMNEEDEDDESMSTAASPPGMIHRRESDLIKSPSLVEPDLILHEDEFVARGPPMNDEDNVVMIHRRMSDLQKSRRESDVRREQDLILHEDEVVARGPPMNDDSDISSLSPHGMIRRDKRMSSPPGTIHRLSVDTRLLSRRDSADERLRDLIFDEDRAIERGPPGMSTKTSAAPPPGVQPLSAASQPPGSLRHVSIATKEILQHLGYSPDLPRTRTSSLESIPSIASPLPPPGNMRRVSMESKRLSKTQGEPLTSPTSLVRKRPFVRNSLSAEEEEEEEEQNSPMLERPRTYTLTRIYHSNMHIHTHPYIQRVIIGACLRISQVVKCHKKL